ncbi:MAG: ATP-binding protein [Planctomycetota bacterium]
MEPKKKQILLVEDDDSHAELITRAFEHREEFSIVVKQTLQSALLYLKENNPHLVISDLRLPDGEGIQLLQQDSHKRNYPLVIMTSQGDEKIAVEIMKAGALDYIVKNSPIFFDMPHIADRILREWNHILQKKQAEEELLQMNIQLKKANEELKLTQVQLIQSAKLASLGELATGIAHELNQPLATISMNAEMMLEFIQEATQEEFFQSYQLILQQVERSSQIIRHLRVFGRESTLEKCKLQEFNLLIKNSLTLLKEQFRLRTIEIVFDLANPSPLVWCNAIQIEQVLTNLFLNARDALEKSPQKKITIRSFIQEKYGVCEVEDTGIGIAEKNQARIFDPFFTTKEVGKGTGLGLSISYGIIKNHHGFIEVQSQEGQGALFRIRLPSIVSETYCAG